MEQNKNQIFIMSEILLSKLTSSGTNDMPSTPEGALSPANATMVGMISMFNTNSLLIELAGIPGPLIISGMRMSNSYSWRLSFGSENWPVGVVMIQRIDVERMFQNVYLFKGDFLKGAFKHKLSKFGPQISYKQFSNFHRGHGRALLRFCLGTLKSQ